MISFTLGIALAILAGLGFTLLFVWLWKKMKKNPVGGGVIGCFVGIIAATGILVVPSHAYVVHGDNDYSQYLVYSNTTYTTSENKLIHIGIKQTQCAVINDSDTDYSIQTVIYGFGFGSVETLEAHSHLILEYSRIDHFFDDVPPETIEIEVGENVSVLWLRKQREDDAQMNMDPMDAIQELLTQ